MERADSAYLMLKMSLHDRLIERWDKREEDHPRIPCWELIALFEGAELLIRTPRMRVVVGMTAELKEERPTEEMVGIPRMDWSDRLVPSPFFSP